jgi:hypothetical protein
MGKTINKGPCYCCEQSSSVTSSVTSSVSSSTSSVTSSSSGDFCCDANGVVGGQCMVSYTQPDGPLGECAVYAMDITFGCASFLHGQRCDNDNDRTAIACFDNFPECAKEIWCNIGPEFVACGPADITNCFWNDIGAFECIGIVDENDTVHGYCVGVDTNAGSPCPDHDCECSEANWFN